MANGALQTFLHTFYAATLPATPDLTQLLRRYLDENPDGLAEVTARLKKLLVDAGVGS